MKKIKEIMLLEFLQRYKRGIMELVKEIQPVFEYDEAKSRSNLEKHGMDFKEAKALWADKRRLQVPVEHKGERRSMLFAHYAGSI